MWKENRAMSITDELREYATNDSLHYCSDYLAIADRIDAEHESACAEAYGNGVMSVPIALDESAWVELPKDADGEYIHVGDTLDGYGKTIEVVELRYGRSGWVIISRDGNGYADTFAFTHHKPTVEDVLREFAYGLGVPVADSYIAASAAKLRLAEGEDA
jgi:hypothetical protein